MTLSPLELFSVLLFPLLLGAGLLRLLGVVPRTDRIAYAGWAWLLGSLGVAVVLSVWLWFELPLSATAIAPVLLALAAAGFLLGRRIPPEVSAPVPAQAFPRWERCLFAAVLAFALLVTADRILCAANEAIVDADEAHIWAAKAKVMFSTGGFGEGFREALRTPRVVDHPDYPPLNPLLQLWVFAHAGEIVHVENRLPIQAFGIAYVLLAASALRRRARPLVAALFLAGLGTIGLMHLSMDQAFSDVLVSVAFFVAWDLWQRFQEDGELLWLRLLGATAPVLVLSKNEGAMLLAAAGAGLAVATLARRVRLPARGEFAHWLPWGLPLLVAFGYVFWFNRHFELVNDLWQSHDGADGGTTGFLQIALEDGRRRVAPIVAYFASLMFARHTNYLLLAFLASLVLAPASAFGRGRMTFSLALCFALLGYMAVYLGTHWELQRHLHTSAHRLLFHLVPSVGLWLLLFVVDALPALGCAPVARARLEERRPAAARHYASSS